MEAGHVSWDKTHCPLLCAVACSLWARLQPCAWFLCRQTHGAQPWGLKCSEQARVCPSGLEAEAAFMRQLPACDHPPWRNPAKEQNALSLPALPGMPAQCCPLCEHVSHGSTSPSHCQPAQGSLALPDMLHLNSDGQQTAERWWGRAEEQGSIWAHMRPNPSASSPPEDLGTSPGCVAPRGLLQGWDLQSRAQVQPSRPLLELPQAASGRSLVACVSAPSEQHLHPPRLAGGFRPPWPAPGPDP